MRSVNNDPTIACPNANWNGATTNYCNGVTADDVVAHEWGHAYTEFTHDLIYQWQSGALNESYSDIWGETVDLINGYGTDSPAGPPRRPRDDGGCTTHSLLRNFVVINSPASHRRLLQRGGRPVRSRRSTRPASPATWCWPTTASHPTSDGCEPFVNAAAVSGNIALVDRGTCAFTVKVANAQAAGATGVLVADNVWGPPDPLAGVDPTITIPSVRITLQSGNAIKGAARRRRERHDAARTAGVARAGQRPVADGRGRHGLRGPPRHAIRDMWNPRCVNDPGRVTDGEYFCSTLDGGGVHTNSGVPNHGYALLVDGGIYNGHAISAIGFVKAAHLYFRAQSVYQTPVDQLRRPRRRAPGVVHRPHRGRARRSEHDGRAGRPVRRVDHRRGLRAGRRDDRGGRASGRPGRAVQLPADPAAGGARLLLGHAERADRRLHRRLRGWARRLERTNEGVFAGWPGIDWVQDTTLPGDRPGAAAFGEDLQEGNCDGGAGDVSGHMMLTSGTITIPDVAQTTPRLAFDHYVATEAGWDGGNMKISINGGSFFVPPDAAYTFNSYNVPNLNTAAQGNTNPLAGQDGWTGTDGGSLGGSWGQSQLDLAALGVTGGDTIRLQFDFGMDGCTGIDGWYVDDVRVFLCDLNAQPEVTVVPGGTCNSNLSATLNLNVTDDEIETLALSATSSNQRVVPNSGLVFGGSGSDRTLTITASRGGSSVVTVTATDESGKVASVQISVLVGGNGADILRGTSGPDVILGGNGADRLNGIGGTDLICGSNGADRINGDLGDDTMSGGNGDDTLTGGPGADAFNGGSGTDTATDFNAGEGDTSTDIP